MEKYETVIVGAGPAGLKAAETLAKAGREVLVLEKDKVFGDKVCAGGLTLNDFELGIPEKIVDRKFKKAVLHTPFQKTEVKQKDFFVATVERKALGKWMAKQAEKAGAKIWINSRVNKIGKDYVVVGKKKIGFKYLIGADGSNSTVRKSLVAEDNKTCLAIQYKTKKIFKNLEIFFDVNKFGPWYAWIFPHKNCTLIGSGANPKYMKIKTLKRNLNKWCEGKFDIKKAEFQAHTIRWGHKGYKFGNKYLIGDAGGFASVLSGEGIRFAMLSGIDIARKIINPRYKCRNIEHIIRMKKAENKVLKHMEKHKTLAKLEIETFVFLLKSKWIDREFLDAFELIKSKEKKDYDVIIVGAGPAGLTLAKLLDNSNLNVLLVEKRNTIKKLGNNIFATFREIVDKFKLHNAVLQDIPHIRLYGPTKSVKFDFVEKPLAVLDFNKWAGKLKLSCNVKTNTEIVSAKRIDGGIQLTDSKKDNYSGKIVVDCSGNSQVVSTKLGIPASPVTFDCLGFVMENCNIPDMKEGSLNGDLRLANGGGWFYPLPGNRCQVALGDLLPYKTSYKKNLRQRVKYMVHDFKPYSNWLKNAKIVSQTHKKAPPVFPHSHMTQDNFISIGDAGGQATPLIGEGIRPALEMALAASKVIKKAFKKNDFSNKTMLDFEKQWHDKFGKYYMWSFLIRHIWVYEFSNEDIDNLVIKLQKLPKNEFFKFTRSQIDLKMIEKLVDFEMFDSVIVKFFRNHLPHFLQFRERHG